MSGSSKIHFFKKNLYIFTIGTFLTRLLTFIIVPIFSFYITTQQYGDIDIITSLINLMLPISAFAFYEALLKYLLDGKHDNKKVVTNSSLFCLISIFIMSLTIGICGQYVYQDYLVATLILFVFQGIQIFMTSLAQGMKKTFVYIISSILFSIGFLLCSSLFVTVGKFGVNGYLYGMAIGTFISVLFSFICIKPWQYFSFKSFDKSLMKEMFIYSVPLIFANISYWIMTASDKYVTKFVLGSSDSSLNGILAVVQKIPTLLIVLSSIFESAYRISSFSDFQLESADDKGFYIGNFNILLVLMVVGCTGISLLCYPFIKYCFEASYVSSWIYIPLYSFATVLLCLKNFFINLYCLKKKTLKLTLIVCGAALINLVSCILIMKYTSLGLWGAPISTLLASLFTFLFFYFDSQKIIKIKIRIIDWVNISLTLCITIIPCFTDNYLMLIFGSLALFIYLCIFYRSWLFLFIKKILPSKKETSEI